MIPAARGVLVGALIACACSPARARLGRVLLADTQSDSTIVGDAERDLLGGTQAIGDLDGDGIDDLLLGTWDDLRPGSLEILLGPILPGQRDLRSQPADIRIESDAIQARLGDVANVRLGDLDGDAHLDIIVGAPDEVLPRLGAGIVRVLFGPFTPGTHAIDALPGLRIVGGGRQLGISLAIGDVSGDGIPDLAMGETRNGCCGRVHVLFGPLAPGFLFLQFAPADFTLTGAPTVDDLGYSLAIADVSGDRAPDLLVGAPSDDGRLRDRLLSGAIHVIRGPLARGGMRDLRVDPADTTIHGARGGVPPSGRGGDRLGVVIRAADLDLDGATDIVSSGWPAGGAGGEETAGLVSVVFGPLTASDLDLLTVPNQARVFGAEADDALGWDILLTDVNADGVTDLIVGALRGGAACAEDVDPGVAHVFYGPIAPGMLVNLATDVSDLAITGTEPLARCGLSRAAADLDGDGTTDLVFSCYTADRPDGSAPDAGITYVLSPEAPAAQVMNPCCDAGAAVTVACDAPRRACGIDVQLDGSASRDARGGALTFAWEIACGASIVSAVGASPIVCLDAAPGATCDATLTVTSPEGLASSCTTSIELAPDAGPPQLSGVPPDAVASCNAVPPAPVVTASDDCGAVDVVLDERREPGACAGSYTLMRTWTATDAAGHVAAEEQRIAVIDEEPPIIVAGDAELAVLWAPNHRMTCFDAASLSPSITESCSPPATWRIVDCVSDQPDDGHGDGATHHDCVVAPDGQSACVRSERAGDARAGRRYALSIVATDACGNASAPTLIGVVRVPHDQRRRR